MLLMFLLFIAAIILSFRVRYYDFASSYLTRIRNFQLSMMAIYPFSSRRFSFLWEKSYARW